MRRASQKKKIVAHLVMTDICTSELQLIVELQTCKSTGVNSSPGSSCKAALCSPGFMQIIVTPAGAHAAGWCVVVFFFICNVQPAALLHVTAFLLLFFFWSQDRPRGIRGEGARRLHGCASSSSSSSLLTLRTREMFPVRAPESAADL